MPQYKLEISQTLWEAVQTKARRAGTTPDAMIDVRVGEFLDACLCEVRDERRNSIISRIVNLSAHKLDLIEQAVEKAART